MQVAIKNQSGAETGRLELDDSVFNVPMNPSLVHQALVMYQANRRQGTHDTKTRAEVSGGGRKPWIQKHTGRARQGSTRAPQWRHGGVVFGPHPRSYRKAMPKRMRRLALRCMLSDKLRSRRLVCIDGTGSLDGKTRSMVELLRNLEVSGSALLVTRQPEPNAVYAAGNLQKIRTLPVNQLNAEELLSRETLIMTADAAQWAAESLAETAEPHGRRGRKFRASDDAAAEAEALAAVVEPEEAEALTAIAEPEEAEATADDDAAESDGDTGEAGAEAEA